MESKLFIESLNVIQCFKYIPKIFKLKIAYSKWKSLPNQDNNIVKNVDLRFH